MTDEEVLQSFLESLTSARQAVEAACAMKDADKIKSAAEELMCIADDETVYHYLDLLTIDVDAINQTMLKAIEALRAAGCSAAEVIVWVYKVCRPLGGMCPDELYNSFLEFPRGEYAESRVWLEVAERLQTELKSFKDDQFSPHHSDGVYQLQAIRVAWERAGCEQRALDMWIEYAPKIRNWKEVSALLNGYGRYDEAIKIAREGVRVFEEDGELGDAAELMEPLAAAFSGKGDHQKAAAILAEQFLDWIGAYEHHRTVGLFDKVVAEAKRAGVGDETRAAIIHALKTGVNPEPLWDWKVEAPVQEVEWRRAPKLVAYRAPDAPNEAPRWPLPRSNEGLKFRDLRWGTMQWLCQQDQEFLLKLALAEGDKEEIIRRFEALPEFQHRAGWSFSVDQLVLDAVAAAVGDIRPEAQ